MIRIIIKVKFKKIGKFDMTPERIKDGGCHIEKATITCMNDVAKSIEHKIFKDNGVIPLQPKVSCEMNSTELKGIMEFDILEVKGIKADIKKIDMKHLNEFLDKLTKTIDNYFKTKNTDTETKFEIRGK